MALENINEHRVPNLCRAGWPAVIGRARTIDFRPIDLESHVFCEQHTPDLTPTSSGGPGLKERVKVAVVG
jgi:hypothetical protein